MNREMVLGIAIGIAVGMIVVPRLRGMMAANVGA